MRPHQHTVCHLDMLTRGVLSVGKCVLRLAQQQPANGRQHGQQKCKGNEECLGSEAQVAHQHHGWGPYAMCLESTASLLDLIHCYHQSAAPKSCARSI